MRTLSGILRNAFSAPDFVSRCDAASKHEHAMSLAAAQFTYTIAGMALPITTLRVDRDSKYAAELKQSC